MDCMQNCIDCNRQIIFNDELPLITSGFLILTQRCSLKCKYCFVVQKPKDMTLKVAIDAADFLYNNAKKQGETPSINFFGGEPMLKYNSIIVPLVKYIREKYGKEFQLGMTTNGLHVNERNMDFLLENNISIMVSFDGNKETQDKNRRLHNGKSSFDIIASKIPMFLKMNPEMTFRSTLDHDNVSEYFNNFKFAVENGYKNIFSIVNVFSEWSEEEREELKNQVNMLGEYLIISLLQGKSYNFNPLQSMFQKYYQIKSMKENREFRSQGNNAVGSGRCGIGASKFASIGTDGTLYSCQEMADNFEEGYKFEMGSIYTEADTRKRWDIINMFNIKTVKCDDDSILCEKCKLNCMCDGGCLINNYFKTRDINKMPSILCYYYKLLFDEAERIIEVAGGYKEMVNRFTTRGILK